MFTVQRYSGFKALPQAYSTVFERASEQSFFLSQPWFTNFAATIVGGEGAVVIYGVEKKELMCSPVGALVLWSRIRNIGVLSPRKLEGLANYYTSYFAPALACDDVDMHKTLRALALALWSDRASWDVLNLRPLDQTSLIYTSLIKVFKEVGMVVQTYFCFGNWYLELAGRSYADYFKSLPAVLRKNIPYMNRKLERTFRVRTEIITAGTGLEQALDDYERVYNTSWRNREPYPQFIRGLARLAAQHGWLRLGLIYLDGEPTAAQLWIVHAGVASIYKVCYDERFAKFSVGTLLTSRLMQYVIDVDRVREVDYLSGDDDYKQHWMSHRRERWGIMAFNPRRAKGLMQAIRHVGGRSVKRTLTGFWHRAPRVGHSARKLPGDMLGSSLHWPLGFSLSSGVN
jgi:Acetyltransferase (GNAT) domain